MTIPRKGSGRPRKGSRRKCWDFGELNVGGFRVVPRGVSVPWVSIKICEQNTGFTYTTRRQPNGETRVYRVS